VVVDYDYLYKYYDMGTIPGTLVRNEIVNQEPVGITVSSSSRTYCPFCAVFSVHNIFLTVLVHISKD
jgi:hypothetical protein